MTSMATLMPSHLDGLRPCFQSLARGCLPPERGTHVRFRDGLSDSGQLLGVEFCWMRQPAMTLDSRLFVGTGIRLFHRQNPLQPSEFDSLEILRCVKRSIGSTKDWAVPIEFSRLESKSLTCSRPLSCGPIVTFGCMFVTFFRFR